MEQTQKNMILKLSEPNKHMVLRPPLVCKLMHFLLLHIPLEFSKVIYLKGVLSLPYLDIIIVGKNLGAQAGMDLSLER